MELATQAGAVTPKGTKGLFQPSVVSLLVPIDGLTEDPDNVRLHPEENLVALRSSLTTFGQTKPAVVRAGVVVAGNGTLRIARDLGWTHIAAVEFSGDKKFAAAYAIADNRVPELATWDQPKLDAQLALLSQEWASDGLEWTADTVGFEAASAEPRDAREPNERSESPAGPAPLPPAAAVDAAWQAPCPTCGAADTVCAPCILAELHELLAETDENVAGLASASWLTVEQVRGVLQAIKAKHPALSAPPAGGASAGTPEPA